MSAKGYTQIFHSDPMQGNFFGKQILGGACITIAMTGLDQEMMQKNISVRTLKDAQKNMITFCFILLGVNLLFLLLGGLLYLQAGDAGIQSSFQPGLSYRRYLPDVCHEWRRSVFHYRLLFNRIDFCAFPFCRWRIDGAHLFLLHRYSWFLKGRKFKTKKSRSAPG